MPRKKKKPKPKPKPKPKGGGYRDEPTTINETIMGWPYNPDPLIETEEDIV